MEAQNSASPAACDGDRTTAVGLARYAYEYIDAAHLVACNAMDRGGSDALPPAAAYFLIHHGIELSLKAYLRYCGMSPRELAGKGYGHNLRACLRKARELRLLDHYKASDDDLRALRLLVDLNQDHALRYIRTGAKEYPLWGGLHRFAVQLHRAVAPVVGYHRIFTVSFPAEK